VLIRRVRCLAASAAIHECRVVSRSANRGRAEPDRERSRCPDRAMAGSFRETRPGSVSSKVGFVATIAWWERADQTS
jgi:hypothetical protein